MNEASPAVEVGITPTSTSTINKHVHAAVATGALGARLGATSGAAP